MNVSITVKPRNTLVAPQRGHRALEISTDASSINLVPTRSRGTVSTTAPQELHLRSATSPRSSMMRQPSHSAPVATSWGTIRYSLSSSSWGISGGGRPGRIVRDACKGTVHSLWFRCELGDTGLIVEGNADHPDQ